MGGEAQGTKAGCERRVTGERTGGGAAGHPGLGFRSVREQRDRPQSGKDSVRAGGEELWFQMTGQGPL